MGGKLLVDDNKFQQVFFDDHVDHDDPRIVDCWNFEDERLPPARSLDRLCVKVNAVLAIMQDDYFRRLFDRCCGREDEDNSQVERRWKRMSEEGHHRSDTMDAAFNDIFFQGQQH